MTWADACAQRARWLRGTHDASRQFARRLLIEGIKRRDPALLDGALQAYLPSYSTLTLITLAAFVIQLTLTVCDLQSASCELRAAAFGSVFLPWLLLIGALFLYPLFGLILEGAPLKAYLFLLSGPVFILWRTWLALTARLRKQPVVWVRTAHGGGQASQRVRRS